VGLSSFKVSWSPPRNFENRCFETEYIMAFQGHPRSLILAPIESVYATLYWSSIVTLVKDIASFLLRRAAPPYSTRILDVFLLD